MLTRRQNDRMMWITCCACSGAIIVVVGYHCFTAFYVISSLPIPLTSATAVGATTAYPHVTQRVAIPPAYNINTHISYVHDYGSS